VPVTADDPERAWADPGVFEVSPDIYRVPLPLPDPALRAVNVYVLKSQNGIQLIDSGQATIEAHDALKTGLDTLGFTFDDITSVATTHLHADHFTQGIALRRQHALKIGLGAWEQVGMEKILTRPPGNRFETLALLGRAGADKIIAEILASPMQDPAPGMYEEPDRWLNEAEQLGDGDHPFTAIHTPGHTRGHMVFLHGDRPLMFTGDHVLPRITPSIGLEPTPGKRPLADFLESLHKVRALPDVAMLPAHGPVRDSVHQRVDELLLHHAHRLAAIEHLVDVGAHTAFTIAERLTWTRHERTLDELDLFNRMLATLETLAHLDVLSDQGRVIAEGMDPMNFRPV